MTLTTVVASCDPGGGLRRCVTTGLRSPRLLLLLLGAVEQRRDVGWRRWGGFQKKKKQLSPPQASVAAPLLDANEMILSMRRHTHTAFQCSGEVCVADQRSRRAHMTAWSERQQGPVWECCTGVPPRATPPTPPSGYLPVVTQGLPPLIY